MRRAAVSAVIAVVLTAAAAPALASSPPARETLAAHSAPVLAAFRSHSIFGGSRYRGYGYGYGNRPRHSLLHRAVKTAIWLYILHLFFTHGGLSILMWIVIIGLVISFVRRRRRYAYREEIGDNRAAPR